MLGLPTVGMHPSVERHNVDFSSLCDWIEASVLFENETDELSATEVLDVLTETGVYVSQDFAWQIVSSAWGELSRRLSWIGGATPIAVTRLSLRRLTNWRDAPAHSFCLALSLAKPYREWARQFGADYNQQGELFERLTKEAMEKLFPDWIIHATGWSRTRAVSLNRVVREIVNLLREALGDVQRWTRNSANEAGLDLLCYRPFHDGRIGIPVYLMQCASGGNWEGKLHTPNLRIWKKIVLFAADPKKAFAMPFARVDEDFIRECNLVVSHVAIDT